MHAVLQAEPFAAGVRRFDFDQGLAPYNLHAYQQWQNLSSYISKQTISKLSPLPSGNISITAEADPAHLRPVTAAEKQLYAQLHEGRSDSTKSGEVLVIAISTPCSVGIQHHSQSRMWHFIPVGPCPVLHICNYTKPWS